MPDYPRPPATQATWQVFVPLFARWFQYKQRHLPLLGFKGTREVRHVQQKWMLSALKELKALEREGRGTEQIIMYSLLKVLIIVFIQYYALG